jgi:hypothetical protein
MPRETNQPQVTCPELFKNRKPRNVSDLFLYDRLHPLSRSLISNWLKRAWKKRNCEPEEIFEPFIYTWISFNGWAACITELDHDREWLDALMVDQAIAAKFEMMVGDSDSPVSRYGHQFREMWPIFKAKEIRRVGILPLNKGDRQDIVRRYLAADLRDYEPNCWTKHRNAGESTPLDWQHTLNALYQVRCNLFHGEKDSQSETDGLIVSRAFGVLVHFLHHSNYIDKCK